MPFAPGVFMPTTKKNRRQFLKTVGAGAVASGVAANSALAQLNDGAYPDQDQSEVRWGFLIDLRRCAGCTACAVACKTRNDVRLGVFRNSVITHETGSYPNPRRDFVPWLCNHCKNPPCLAGCIAPEVLGALTFPSGQRVEYLARATYQRPDGLVLIDQERCMGCGQCASRCPYQVRYMDPVKPAGGNPQVKAADKCSMCVTRLEEGVVPACVNTCPAGARMVGNLNDPASEISQQIQAAGGNVATLLPGVNTDPQVYYIGLSQQALNDAFLQGTEPRQDVP
jgi:tetrathionate reductase subunit B